MAAPCSRSPSRRREFFIAGVFALAALVRFVLDTGRGYEGDVELYLAQTWKTVHYGIQSAYLEINGVPPSDNPPLLLYPFWLLGWLYRQFISPSFPPTWLNEPAILRFMLRLPSLFADLFAGAIIFRTLRRMSLGFTTTLIATSAYLFNPALIFDSAYWGQTAAVHTLFMLLSLIATDRRAYGWAGATLAAAVLTKPQAHAIVGLVLMLAARERGLVRFSVAGLVTALLITAPFLVTGKIEGVAMQYLHTADFHPVVAANAHNCWWLITGGHGWRPDTQRFGPLSFRSVGLLLFGCVTLLSMLVVYRERRLLFLAASYQSLAFYMLNTQIHENHSLSMFAPLVIALALDQRAWWLYGAFTFTAVANMALHDPSLFIWAGYPEDEIYGGPAFALPRWLNAAAQTVLFAVFTWRLVQAMLGNVRPRLAGMEGD